MRCFCLMSNVCLSVTYIGPKSRSERPRKTKIGTEVAHISHVIRTPLSRSKRRRSRSPGRFAQPIQLLFFFLRAFAKSVAARCDFRAQNTQKCFATDPTGEFSFFLQYPLVRRIDNIDAGDDADIFHHCPVFSVKEKCTEKNMCGLITMLKTSAPRLA